MKLLLMGVALIFLVFLFGCDPCYYDEGQVIKFSGTIIQNQSNGIHNDTCDIEKQWVYIKTENNCILATLSYMYNTCVEGNSERTCLDKTKPYVSVKGIYQKIEVNGELGRSYYYVTPYECADSELLNYLK